MMIKVLIIIKIFKIITTTSIMMIIIIIAMIIMAWMDYRKAYDMVQHSWIIECLDLFGVADYIKSFLVNIMEKWKVMLCSRNSELGEIEIKRCIFQEDSLSPLVFVLALIPLSFQKGEGSI